MQYAYHNDFPRAFPLQEAFCQTVGKNTIRDLMSRAFQYYELIAQSSLFFLEVISISVMHL